ncbi:MAG TPA: ATP-binding protein [Gemmataceae bacterium]|nr:ATP-binding protein [Gemmataceae bacterium]
MAPVSRTPPPTPPNDSPAGQAAELAIPTNPLEVRRVQNEIEQLLQANQLSESDVFAVKLAVEEALINAIKHGNQMDPRKKVHITYRLLPDRFDIRITDEGPGFDPAEVPDPTTPENLERPCGRGLMLMRHYMNEVVFNERGNSVHMSRRLGNGAS